MSVKVVHNGVTFGGDKLLSVKIINEFNFTFENIAESVADITFKITDVEAVFDKNKEFEIYFDETLNWSGWLDTVEKQTKNTWAVSLSGVEGYLKRLEAFEFEGDMYTGKSALEIINEIKAITGYDWINVTDNISADTTISGWIAYSNCRNALEQVLFVTGWHIVSGKGLLIDNANSSDSYRMPLSRILQHEKIKESEPKNDAVTVSARSWKNKDGPSDYFELYLGEKDNPFPDGTIIRTKTTKPFYEATMILSGSHVQETSSGKIVETGANYFDFYTTVEGLFSPGFNYYSEFVYVYYYIEHVYPYTKSIQEDTEPENVFDTGEKYTLVNEENYQDILDRCFEFVTNGKELNTRIVEGKHEINGGIVYDPAVKIGDYITIPTEFQGAYTGRIVKEQYTLNGNIIFKDLTIK
jgi:hypothetical protein